MKDCIFCKIANNESSSFKLFEDELVVAFLNVNPTSNGHLLVISKQHFENVFEVPIEVLNRINEICKKMAVLCKDKLGATGVNILNASGEDAQQSVFHIHFHVVPRYRDDELDLWFHGKSKDFEEIEEVQEKLLS